MQVEAPPSDAQRMIWLLSAVVPGDPTTGFPLLKYHLPGTRGCTHPIDL